VSGDVNLFDSRDSVLLDAEVANLDKGTVLKLEVDKSLETAINELNALSKEYSQNDADNLIARANFQRNGWVFGVPRSAA